MVIMDAIILIAAGIIFNFIPRFTKLYGVDAMPAFPLIAGYIYGTGAGFWSGLVIAVSYYLINARNIAYAPLTIGLNIITGFAAGLLTFLGFFEAGMLLLVAYHAISFLAVSIFGLKPGYFLFAVMSFISNLVLIYAASTLF
jgi:hypothetical protein